MWSDLNNNNNNNNNAISHSRSVPMFDRRHTSLRNAIVATWNVSLLCKTQFNSPQL